jgi:hypothetical protein
VLDECQLLDLVKWRGACVVDVFGANKLLKVHVCVLTCEGVRRIHPLSMVPGKFRFMLWNFCFKTLRLHPSFVF